MQKKFMILVVGLFCFSLCAESDVVRKISGTAELSDQHCASLEINGEATLTKVTVDKLLSINGLGTLNECTFCNVNINGDVTMTKGTVAGTLETNGTCKIDGVEIKGACDLNGDVKIDNATIHALSEVTGSFKALNTTFYNQLTAESEKISLHKCTTKDIRIKKTEPEPSIWRSFLNLFFKSTDNTQEVRLTDTQVQGDIIFEANNGIVYLAGSSKVSGKIIGGRVAG